MKIDFLGGAGEVGASCILVKINDKNILMDCGIRQGGSSDTLPDFRRIQEEGGVDAILISHGHMDHIGALPIIAKEYPLAKVYCNNMTKDIMRVLLYDSIKIMNRREAEIPLYGEVDVVNLLDRTYTYNYEVPFQVFNDIRVTFYLAGHIPGAACIYITSEEGSLFYSGDFSLFSQITVEGAKFPKLRPDVAIIESTYGDKLHSSRKLEEEKLVNYVKEIIRGQGKVLVPAFALGRAQEVILILKRAINNGQLPKVKVYVDGMVRDMNTVFKRNPLYLKNSLSKKILKGTEPFYDKNIIAVSTNEERKEALESKEPVIIVSSSGMLTGGPSQTYAEGLLQDEKSAIIVSGYQDEESPGRRLLNLFEVPDEDRVLDINNKTIPVKCRIEKVSLSAHGDKSEIKAVIDRVSPKKVFLVHGNKEVIASLGKEMLLESERQIYTPSLGDSFNIDIYNPRKQLNKKIRYRMNNEIEDLNENTLGGLREFIIKNYGYVNFTVEDLLRIWCSNDILNINLKEYEKLLIETPYFLSDSKRVFMFSPTEPEELNNSLKSGELNQTEVHNCVKEKLKEYGVKKVGLNVDEKSVMVSFDFPKALPKEVYEIINEIKIETNWNIEIKLETNYNALNTLITKLVGMDKVDKISYNPGEDYVTLKLNREINMEEVKAEVLQRTGFTIEIKGENSNIQEVVVDKGAILEQNDLITLVDTRFMNALDKPYKKSISSIGNMKLTFISPEVGSRYSNIIEELRRDSGWSIEINNSYNQNDILNLVQLLCETLDMNLKKRPAFLLVEKKVKVQFEKEVSEEDYYKLNELVYEKTGLNIKRPVSLF